MRFYVAIGTCTICLFDCLLSMPDDYLYRMGNAARIFCEKLGKCKAVIVSTVVPPDSGAPSLGLTPD